MKDMSYEAVMGRQNEIVNKALGIDYRKYEKGGIVFDYEAMMEDIGIDIDQVVAIQSDMGVGHTPLMDLKNITALSRKLAKPGMGARILVKDEAANPSGSFKARRAAQRRAEQAQHEKNLRRGKKKAAPVQAAPAPQAPQKPEKSARRPRRPGQRPQGEQPRFAGSRPVHKGKGSPKKSK